MHPKHKHHAIHAHGRGRRASGASRPAIHHGRRGARTHGPVRPWFPPVLPPFGFGLPGI